MLKNKDFRIVYQPAPSLGIKKRRFLVSVNTLAGYIGATNASTAFLRALNSPLDKTTIKFRKYGRIDFYVK